MVTGVERSPGMRPKRARTARAARQRGVRVSEPSRRIRGPGSRQRGAPGCYVFLRFALPHRASITFRMIARRSSAVVPAQRAACAFPAAALPPRRPSATAAGFFRSQLGGAESTQGAARAPGHRANEPWLSPPSRSGRAGAVLRSRAGPPSESPCPRARKAWLTSSAACSHRGRRHSRRSLLVQLVDHPDSRDPSPPIGVLSSAATRSRNCVRLDLLGPQLRQEVREG